MRVHNNEIILSWLRTEDSYYENETWHIHETELIRDADGHYEKCACGYESEKIRHIFGQWSTIPVVNGDKKEVVRRCYCGYEEFKEVKDTDDAKTQEIVLICVGSVLVVAAAVTAVVIIKKKKAQK